MGLTDNQCNLLSPVPQTVIQGIEDLTALVCDSASHAKARECADSVGRRSINPSIVILPDDDDVTNAGKCISWILQFYGFEEMGEKFFGLGERFEQKLKTLSLNGRLFDYLKCKLPATFSWGMFQPLPDCSKFSDIDSEPHFFLCGRACRFLRVMRSRSLKDKASFFLSFLYIKKGLNRPSEDRVFKGALDTYDDLTKFREDSSNPLMEECKESVRRTVKEVLDGVKATDFKLVAPSARAHWNYSRSQVGAMGALRDLGYLGSASQYTDMFKSMADGDLAMPYFVFWNEECIQPSIPLLIIPSWMDDFRRRIFKDLTVAALIENPNCAPLGLAEPLKVRVISKGPSATYALMHSLQKVLWKALGRFPNFIINKVLEPTDLLRLKKKDHQYWVSGDYKSATNELNPELSRVCIEEIVRCLNLPPSLEDLFYRAMTDHIVWKPKKLDDRHTIYVEPLKQQWGQLMGSPVSFPILCMVNAALTRLVWGSTAFNIKYGCDVASCPKLEDCPMLINGDDVVFVGWGGDYHIWKEYTSCGGLSESIGKTYVSSDWLIMNSDMYIPKFDDVPYDIKEGNLLFERVENVNLALMIGLKRSGGAKIKNEKELEDDMGTFGARCCKLVEGFYGRRKEILVDQFVSHNKDSFPKFTPWFLSTYYGGLGLPCIGRFQPTKLDESIAGAMVRGWIPFPPSRTAANWQDRIVSTKFYDRAEREARDLTGVTSLETNGHLLTDFLFWVELLFGSWAIDTKIKEDGTFSLKDMDRPFDMKQSVDKIDQYWRKISSSKEVVGCRSSFISNFRLDKEFVRAQCIYSNVSMGGHAPERCCSRQEMSQRGYTVVECPESFWKDSMGGEVMVF
jgi:hypothetical protein